MNDKLEDQQLVELAKIKNEEGIQAFRKLYEQHYTDLLRYCTRIIGNSDDAEDILAETWVRAYQSIDLLRDGSMFRPWIFRIATHTAKIELQTRQNPTISHLLENTPGSFSEAAEIAASDVEDPAYKLQQKEFMSEVRRAINALPEHHRMVITLHVLEGLSYREIADVMDVPVSTVKTRWLRGIKSLRKSLEQSKTYEVEDKNNFIFTLANEIEPIKS